MMTFLWQALISSRSSRRRSEFNILKFHRDERNGRNEGV